MDQPPTPRVCGCVWGGGGGGGLHKRTGQEGGMRAMALLGTAAANIDH